MTDYSKLSDSEIERLVFDKLASKETTEEGKYLYRVFQESPHRYCSNPEMWGWLLERERISLYAESYGNSGWYAKSPEAQKPTTPHSSPGRAVAIAYLEAE